MRKLLILFFCWLTPLLSSAQLQHYISINVNAYANFFNKEKEPLGPIVFSGHQVTLPEISYKIMKGGHGLELYFNIYNRRYQFAEFGKTNPGDFLAISRLFIGLNYHREVYQSKYFSITPFAGFTYGSYIATILRVWNKHALWTEAIIGGSDHENYFGLQLGGNVKVPIWKGLHLNGNLRYGAVPWAKQDYFRHNMVVNLGLGYKF